MTLRACIVFLSLGQMWCHWQRPASAEPIPSWPQFRGPNGAAVAPDGESPPVEFGPAKNILWKTALPSGASSPCIWADRIFLTAFLKDENRLETLCLDRITGEILWRHPVPAKEIEKPSHDSGSPAASTPAADANRVVAYFGSFGLLCYDHDGNELWNRPTPFPKRRFGTGTSPVLAGDVLLLSRDEEPDRQLLAVDARDGNLLWKQPLPGTTGPGMREGYATPVVNGNEVILHHLGQVTAFDLKGGRQLWSVPAATNGCSTPVLADGTVYVATWNNFGEPDLRTKLPTFDELKKAHDKDGDGLVGKDEFPNDLAITQRPGAEGTQGADVLVIWFFDRIDFNKDGKLGLLEWASTYTLFELMVSQSEHGLVALRAGDDGKRTIAWREKKFVPEVPSPVAYDGRVYMVKDGGILTCLDAATGKLVYRKRLGEGGSYFASPVAADGRIYAASHSGVVTVLAAGDTFEILAQNDLADLITATPALADDTLYLRTASTLYAFRAPSEPRP